MVSEPRLLSLAEAPSPTAKLSHKEPSYTSFLKMSGSMTVEERFEQLIKVNAEKDAQLEYLRK